MKNMLMIAGIVAALMASGVQPPFHERTVVKADGAWEMAQATAPGAWMPAKVPGTVLGTLVANG